MGRKPWGTLQYLKPDRVLVAQIGGGGGEEMEGEGMHCSQPPPMPVHSLRCVSLILQQSCNLLLQRRRLRIELTAEYVGGKRRVVSLRY